MAYHVILEPGIYILIVQFRDFEFFLRVHAGIYSFTLVLVTDRLTCGNRESVSLQPPTKNPRAATELLNPMRAITEKLGGGGDDHTAVATACPESGKCAQTMMKKKRGRQIVLMTCTTAQ